MNAVLTALGSQRPAFYSEADFRHALAWQIQQNHPSLRVRHEVGNVIEGPDRRYVDIWLPDHRTAIELKYPTRPAVIHYEGEEFDLKDHSAQDLGRYDFCLDISRLERVTTSGRAENGYAVLLTNDYLYWNPPSRRDTNDAEFRLHEGRNITGTLAWGPRTGAGTMKGRETPLEIRGDYRMEWRDYSRPIGTGDTQFRCLILRVDRPKR